MRRIPFKKSRLKKFMYWIKERYNIEQLRLHGEEPPWTDDPILQNNFFTNPYREMDKTTVWFKSNLRDPMRNDKVVTFTTVAFRWFNLIRTGELLLTNGLWSQWDNAKAKRLLHKANKDGPVFTGAYIIKVENGRSKIDSCCDQINKFWKQRRDYYSELSRCDSLQEAHRIFKGIKHLGGFMAYEIISDLRWTIWLRDAVDINTWCFVGPGAHRGYNRLCDARIENRTKMEPLPHDHMHHLRWLRDYVNDHLITGMPQFTMREVEHSLCEFDKYARLWLDDGTMKSKRKFNQQAAYMRDATMA